MISVEIACALPAEQLLLALQFPAGTTLEDAVQRSGILQRFPTLDPATLSYGIFSKLEKNPAGRILQNGDRIEIYRPLIIDPKEARRARAEKAKARRAQKD